MSENIEVLLPIDRFSITYGTVTREDPRRVRNAFWLLLKRLKQDCLIWLAADAVPKLTVEQLHWLLECIDIDVVRLHPRRLYERAAANPR